MVCGDFFIQPSEALEEIENNLRGVEAGDEGKIFSTVKDILERRNAQIPMLTAEDITRPLAQAAREAFVSFSTSA